MSFFYIDVQAKMRNGFASIIQLFFEFQFNLN